MKIGLIADWLNPCIAGMLDVLRSLDVAVDVIYPEREVIGLSALSVDHDVYVLKSGTDAALALGGMLHTLGARTVNPFPTVGTLRNKLLVTHALQSAGLPVPETYMVCGSEQLPTLLQAGPLILKPPRGSRGEGIHIVREMFSDSAGMHFNGPMVAQRYHPPDGLDRKLYRIGDRLFGVLRPWPLRTYSDKLGEAFEPTGELREIGYRCGEVFGIDLYGLDVVISDGRPLVVDLNKFGSYIGVPDAPRLLAEHLVSVARK